MAKVYSTETGRLCPVCEQPVANCNCKGKKVTRSSATPPHSRTNKNNDAIYIRRETKGRKGAGVTLIDGLKQDEKQLKLTAKKLKALCGSGGTVKDGLIEIQGDHRSRIQEWLQKQGFKVKLSGG